MPAGLKQNLFLRIGGDDVPCGRVTTLSPDRLTIEILLQDNVAYMRGFPVHLYRKDSYDGVSERIVVLFDGFIQSVDPVSTGSVTSYSTLTAVNGVWDSVGSTILSAVNPTAGMDELIVSGIAGAVSASLAVPEAKFLYSELLKRDTVLPSDIILRFIRSVMHLDAPDLLTQATLFLNNFRMELRKRESGTSIDKPVAIYMSAVWNADMQVKPVSKGVYFSKGALTVVPGEFGEEITEIINRTMSAEEFIQKHPLVAAVLMFSFGDNKTTKLIPDNFREVMHNAVDKRAVQQDADFTVSESEQYYITEVQDFEILLYCDIAFKDISFMYYPPARATALSDTSFRAVYGKDVPAYMKEALTAWLTEKRELAVTDTALKLDVFQKQMRKLVSECSFIRSGTNAGTLKYWNSRAHQKVIDTCVYGYAPSNPLNAVAAVTRKASLDIIRRQLSFTTEGTLLSLLTAFYSAYFMRIHPVFPSVTRLKGIGVDASQGTVLVTADNSMGLAPDLFIPVDDWMVRNFNASYRQDTEDYIFLIRDKLVRDLMGKDTPPHIYDYRRDQLIPIADVDNIFQDDYVNSFHRAPKIVDVVIDRGIVSAMHAQKKEGEGAGIPESYSIDSKRKDVMQFVSDIFRKRFSQMYRDMQIDESMSTAGVSRQTYPYTDDFFRFYKEHLDKTGQPFINTLTPGMIADGAADAYIQNGVAAQGRQGIPFRIIQGNMEADGTFYPIVQSTLDNVYRAAPGLDNSIKDYFTKRRGSYAGVDSGSYQAATSTFWKSLKKEVPILYKGDAPYNSLIAEVHKNEGGALINSLDGIITANGERVQPSRYGLLIDKLFYFANYVGNKSYSKQAFYSIIEEYSNKVRALGYKPGGGITVAVFKNVVSKLPDVEERVLFSSFVDLTEDEASEITYRLLFRGVQGINDTLSLMGGMAYSPSPLVYAPLLEVVFQHGNIQSGNSPSRGGRFSRWIRQEPPRYDTFDGKASVLKWKLSPDRLLVWRRVFSDNYSSTSTTREIWKDLIRLLGVDPGGTTSPSMIGTDLIAFRAYTLQDVKNPGNYAYRVTGLQKWMKEAAGAPWAAAGGTTAPDVTRANPSAEYTAVHPGFLNLARAEYGYSILNEYRDMEDVVPVMGLPEAMKSMPASLVKFMVSDAPVPVFEPVHASDTSKSGYIFDYANGTFLKRDGGDEAVILAVVPEETTSMELNLTRRDVVTSPAEVFQKYDNRIKSMLYFSVMGYFIGRAVQNGDSSYAYFTPYYQSFTDNTVSPLYDKLITGIENRIKEWKFPKEGGKTWALNLLKSAAYGTEYLQAVFSVMSPDTAYKKGHVAGMQLLKEMKNMLRSIADSSETLQSISEEEGSAIQNLPVVPVLEDGQSMYKVSVVPGASAADRQMLTVSVTGRTIAGASSVNTRLRVTQADLAEILTSGETYSPLAGEGLKLIAAVVACAMGYKGMYAQEKSVDEFMAVLSSNTDIPDLSSVVERKPSAMIVKPTVRDYIYWVAGGDQDFWKATNSRSDFTWDQDKWMVVPDTIKGLSHADRYAYINTVLQEFKAAKGQHPVWLEAGIDLWNRLKAGTPSGVVMHIRDERQRFKLFAAAVYDPAGSLYAEVIKQVGAVPVPVVFGDELQSWGLL